MKHFKLSFLLLSFFFVQSVYAQYTLKILLEKIPKFSQNNVPVLVLEKYEKDSFIKIESKKLSGDSTEIISFNIPENTKTGLFSIFIAEKSEKSINKAEFIWNPAEKASFQTYFIDLKNGKISIENSTENQAYAQLLKIKQEADPVLETAYKSRITANLFHPEHKRKITNMELETEKIQLAFDNQLAKLAESYPETYTSKILIPMNLIPIRSAKDDWVKQYDSYLSFLHKYYFYHVDFKNELILNHYAFHDKLFNYLNQYVQNSNDGMKAGIDILFSQLKENEAVNSFVFNTLLKSFIKVNNEAISKYIIENHKAADYALNLPFEELKKLQTIQALSEGGTAPEISLPDQEGNYQSLRAYCQKQNYTILFFWISWCGRCQKETPKMVEIYKKYKGKGLGFYAVSLDEKKENWQEAIQKYGSNWINVSELVPAQQSQVIKNYNLATTPAIFILNKKGEIVSKNLFGEKLDAFISSLMK